MPVRLRPIAVGLAAGLAFAGGPLTAGQPSVSGSLASLRGEGAYGFAVGDIQAVALRDGSGTFPNDGKTMAVNADPKAVAAVLSSAGLPADKLTVSVSSLLLRSGDRLVLLDSGAGAMMPSAGRLRESLSAAGVAPGQITDVVISHWHPDHIGGLVADGKPAFPKARIHVSAPEWAHMKKQENIAGIVRVIEPQVVPFAPGKTIAPGVTAVAIEGHTPGHVGVEVASGGEKLLYIGDAAHHSVISLADPDWRIAFDGDPGTAEASRRALLERAADGKLRLYAPHFPFPGLGTVERRGEGFVWVPAAR